MSLVLWILALTLTLLAIRTTVWDLVTSPWLKSLLLPGFPWVVAVRLLASGASMARLKSIRPPWKRGETVESDPPQLPLFGVHIQAWIPFVTTMAAVLVIRKFAAPDLAFREELHAMDLDLGAVGAFLATSESMLRAFVGRFASESTRPGEEALFLYLTGSMLVLTAPSWTQWKSLAKGLVVLSIALAIFEYFGIRAQLFSRGWFLSWLYGDSVVEAVGFLWMLGLVVFVVALPLRVLWVIVRAIIGQKKEPEALSVKKDRGVPTEKRVSLSR
jgi:hypothetical protein